jgi:hypothetical protein
MHISLHVGYIHADLLKFVMQFVMQFVISEFRVNSKYIVIETITDFLEIDKYVCESLFAVIRGAGINTV